MRRLLVLFCAVLLLSPAARAAEGRIMKVLPQFLDKEGRASLTPSLYDRDAYQFVLRNNPGKRSTLRFAVQWKANTPQSELLRIRVEMVGAVKTDLPKRTSIEMPVRQHHWFSHWAYVVMPKDLYKAFGDVTAWRVTLWDGDKLLSEQKSFLWQ